MTNTFMNELENTFNYKFTENFGVALKTTGSKVYDMFAFGGAYRSRSDKDCILLFKQAYEEDPFLALRCLFYLRDCRGGQGERRFFRVCYHWLAGYDPAAARRNLINIAEYGRWDDYLCLLDTNLKKDVCSLIECQLAVDLICCKKDMGGISLLGKWLPSENAHSAETKKKAKIIRRYLGYTSKEYRKILSTLREHIKVLERLMSENRWGEIKFDKIPSKAGLIYRNAFAKRDIVAERYKRFIMNRDTKVNAGTLYPYEVVEKAIKVHYDSFYIDNAIDRAAVNKYWENLPDYLEGKDPSMMCVIDTSGSMLGRPINVAISLGLYCAERMSGPFANKYISFSSRPQLIHTDGVDFVDKVSRIYETNLCENTDLTKVFDLLLKVARSKNVEKADIPKTIVVISDMEIDYMSNWKERSVMTEMEKVRTKWKAFGYELPKLVYWNVHARNNTILDKEKDVSFVSGCSPVIFKQVLTGKTGIDLMLEVLFNDRYNCIY